LLGFRESNGNFYFIDPSVINSDGRMVPTDTLANTPFTGQVFFNPGAGQVGNLEVNLFDGPSQFITDLSVAKRTRIGGRYGVEVRADIFNLFNTKNWTFNDIDINNLQAGRITGTGAARLMQFSAKFDF
jgi:hypothetical protein